MKFFAALKSADFAAKLSAAAGFDFDAALASGDVNALKAHIDAAVSSAVANATKPDAALAEQVGTLNAALESATAENATLTGSLSAIGFTFPESPETSTKDERIAANKAALEAHINVRAQGILAQTGHPALAEVVEPSKDEIKTANLTGRDRYTADFNRQLAARARRN